MGQPVGDLRRAARIGEVGDLLEALLVPAGYAFVLADVLVP
jgi:hypothetical protein